MASKHKVDDESSLNDYATSPLYIVDHGGLGCKLVYISLVEPVSVLAPKT